MRRVLVVAALMSSLVGCGSEPDPVPHVVKYELNLMGGDRGFADITSIYIYEDVDMPFEGGETVFAGSWSREVTVHYPNVQVLRLSGTFAFDTAVPGASTDTMTSQLRCRIVVDGVLVVEKVARDPRCEYTLPAPAA